MAELLSEHEARGERAARLLRTKLTTERSLQAQGRAKPNPEVAAARLDGMMLALEQVDALPAAERARWRTRIETAGEDHGVLPEVDKHVHRRAAVHLDALIGPLTPESRNSWQRCASAIEAYVQAGVLDPTEALAWRERLRAKLGLEPERPPRCSATELRKVVVPPAARLNGLRVTACELYADGVIARYHWSERSSFHGDTPDSGVKPHRSCGAPTRWTTRPSGLKTTSAPASMEARDTPSESTVAAGELGSGLRSSPPLRRLKPPSSSCRATRARGRSI